MFKFANSLDANGAGDADQVEEAQEAVDGMNDLNVSQVNFSYPHILMRIFNAADRNWRFYWRRHRVSGLIPSWCHVTNY